jgi:predicted negative regulator of RcsB-dependent stress response
MSEPTTSTPISGTSLADIEKAQPAVDQFFDKHQVKLIALVLLLIAVAVVLLVQREIKRSHEETAGALLVSKTESADLEGIIKNYEGTAAAGSSKILLAEQQWKDGKEDDAIATLRGLVDSAEVHPARASALASLAAKLLKQEKTSDAEQLFTELTEDGDASHLAAYAWISLGDIAVKKGDLDAAEKAYTTVEKDFTESVLVQDAVSRRLLMKAASPVEVAAPIELPDTKIIDAEGNAESNVEIKNIQDALRAAGQDVPIIPLPEGNGGGE